MDMSEDTPQTLLLVDDEPNTLSALRRMFRREPYEILMAGSGAQGLQLLEAHEVGVIISDYRMPEMTGVEFLRTVKARYPETLRIVLSGFTDLQSVTAAVNEGAVYKFLTKPWDDTELREVTREAFRLHALQRENRLLNEQLRAANTELERFNRELERRVEEKTRHLEIHAASLRVSQQILDSLPAGVLGVDLEGVIVYANTRASDMMGEAGGALVGALLQRILPDLATAIADTPEDSIHARFSLAGESKIDTSAQRLGRGGASRGWVITFFE